MQHRLLYPLAAAISLIAVVFPLTAQADALPGRLITFQKTFDGWWDVACDTAPDGSDARCYVQYVDLYRHPPDLRAAIVDFLYQETGNGGSEPLITFNIEPDLSFASDVDVAIVGSDGAEKAIPVQRCPTAKCVFDGAPAKAMLVQWSVAKFLRLTIREHSGEIVMRDWPLGNMREMLRIIAKQRKARGLP